MRPCGFAGKFVKIWRGGGLKRREKILFTRGNVSETVKHDERELGFRFERQFRIQGVQIHPAILRTKMRQRNSISETIWQIRQIKRQD